MTTMATNQPLLFPLLFPRLFSGVFVQWRSSLRSLGRKHPVKLRRYAPLGLGVAILRITGYPRGRCRARGYPLLFDYLMCGSGTVLPQFWQGSL